MSMIFPKGMKKGSRIGLLAPASPVLKGEGEKCQRQLEALGFQVLLGEALKKDASVNGYLAGDAKQRAKDLNRMFADPKVEAIFCVRGGYGSAQLLEDLDYEAIGRSPKVFVGYSDITSLHCAFQKKCGFVTFHGPMIRPDLLQETDEARMAYTLHSLFTACFGYTGKTWLFKNPPGERLWVIRNGGAFGRLMGGNLSVLVRLLGTPYCPDFQDSILFLEDVGESVPRVDLCLTQLKLAGVFKQVRGVLLGDFTDCSNKGYESGYDVRMLLQEFFSQDCFSQKSVPVIANVCSDHRRPMATLPLGADCRIEGEQIIFGCKKDGTMLQ